MHLLRSRVLSSLESVDVLTIQVLSLVRLPGNPEPTCCPCCRYGHCAKTCLQEGSSSILPFIRYCFPHL